MATIRCTVNNCIWWGQNNYCNADQILVTASQSPVVIQSDKKGKEAEKLQQTPARDQEATLCYTFEMKQKQM